MPYSIPMPMSMMAKTMDRILRWPTARVANPKERQMETIRETMAASIVASPLKATSSRMTVRTSETTVARVISFWLVVISSCSSTGTPVSPTVTPLNSGSFFKESIALRTAGMASSAGTKPLLCVTGVTVRICILPALAKADSCPLPEPRKNPSRERLVIPPLPKEVNPTSSFSSMKVIRASRSSSWGEVRSPASQASISPVKYVNSVCTEGAADKAFNAG